MVFTGEEGVLSKKNERIMTQIIDRRLNGKNKSAVNRERFIQRFKNQIKKAVSQAMANRSITDIEKGEKITIPAKDTHEPLFQHGKGGKYETVHPGNKTFIKGDTVPRNNAQGEGGGESNASNTGQGEDNFVFEVSRDEFLDLFFDDLELPHLLRKELGNTTSFKTVHAGFTQIGVPSNINIVRTMRGAVGRRVALRGSSADKIKLIEEQLEKIQDPTSEYDTKRKEELLAEVTHLKNRIARIPFIDTFDLRFNSRIKQPNPSTQAVMFCIMDVSGSMDEAKKDIAKRFFILLYLFLKKNYETIEIVFIRHHTSAKEVSEQDFFYSRETGGTVVSSALELTADIITARYPTTDWNIYCAQASDGDNWNNDSPHCGDVLMEKIMPYVQYFAYVEIMPRHHQSLWESYLTIKKVYPQFAMQHIEGAQDIYPIFHELFKRPIHEHA